MNTLKYIVILIILLSIFKLSLAQEAKKDVLIFKNGNCIYTKIDKITQTLIYYKIDNNIEVQSIPIKNIFMIKYANGEKIIFEKLPETILAIDKENSITLISTEVKNNNNLIEQNVTNQVTNTNKIDSTGKSEVNRKGKGIQYSYYKSDSTDLIRQSWKEKNGWLRMRSLNVGGTYLYIDPITGYGFNGNWNSNIFKLNLPDYNSGKSNWSCLTFGYSFTYSTLWTNYDNETSNYWYLNNAFNFGVNFGIGKFKIPTEWKGVILTLNYKPSIQTTKDTSTINYTGFSIDFTISTLNASLDKIAPKAGHRFSVFLIPPIKGLPLYINITYGRVWYINGKNKVKQ